MTNVDHMMSLHMSLEMANDEGDWKLADHLSQEIRDVLQAMSDDEWTHFMILQNDWILALAEL